MTLNLDHTDLIPVFFSSNIVLNWFLVELSSLEANIEGKGEKGGRAQDANVIPSIDPSSNVTDCRYVCSPNMRTALKPLSPFPSRPSPFLTGASIGSFCSLISRCNRN